MTTTRKTLCSCGCAEAHVVARRRTLDGRRVTLWSDGSVMGALGYALSNVPVRRPRTAGSHRRAMRAGWLLMGEVSLCDAEDVPALYAACEKVARSGGDPGDVRYELGRPRLPAPRWDVYRADRDGKPTLRVWRLPRLVWPGLAVMDHCGHERGPRYRVVSVRADAPETAWFTGMAFANLDDLAVYLADVRTMNEGSAA